MTDGHRLFFALWPSAPLRTLIVAQTAQPIASLQGRPMVADNLHVTLAFIGSVTASRLPDILMLARQIPYTGCDLIFDRFAVWSQPRVAVLKTSHIPDSVLQLVAALQMKLAQAGFQIDDRPYQPHVTVAREVRADDAEQPIVPIAWSSHMFVLVESTRTSNGVQYRVLAEFPDSPAVNLAGPSLR